MAAWRNGEGVLNRSGVTLVLTLARYFKSTSTFWHLVCRASIDSEAGWSLWSKDIIFVVPPDSRAGPQAWIDAYHDTHHTPDIESLSSKGGALQGAIVLDYPFDHRFEKIHVLYDGVNGQLPNLDLMNTVVSIASGQMGIPCTLQQMWSHSDSYEDRLKTMLRGMLKQGLGHATGPHSSFIPYHVDALTLQPFGNGWQDEMAMGRVIESTTRSLNNLLEHLHQSFFFYLLMQSNRFVSIGTYLPSAMLVAVNFTIMAIFVWIKSGPSKSKSSLEQKSLAVVQANGVGAVILTQDEDSGNRELLMPLGLVAISHATGLLPLYLFNHIRQEVREYDDVLVPNNLTGRQSISAVFTVFTVTALLSAPLLSKLFERFQKPTSQQYQVVRSFSLLLLGMFLSSLATLNFSLSLLIGLLATPLAYVQPLPHRPALRALTGALLVLSSPMVVFMAVCWYWDLVITKVVFEAAYGWNIWGMYTQLIIWCVWWPAWLVGVILMCGSPISRIASTDQKTAVLGSKK